MPTKRARSVRLGRRLLLVLLAIPLGGATCRPRLDAPPPAATLTAPPELPASRIETFVRIPLDALETQADQVVPRRFRVEPYRMIVEGTEESPVVSAGYEVERDRMALETASGRLVLRTQLAYWVRARRHVGPIDVPGSCGLDDEPRRHFALSVSVDARIEPTLDLTPTLVLRELTATDRCEMTFAGVDVTGRVRSSLQRELETQLPILRTRIRDAVHLRAMAEEAWRNLATPIELDAESVLALGPEALAVTQPTIEGHYLRVGLSLRARPEVYVGSRPSRPIAPLPAAGSVVGEPSIELHVPVRVPYAALADALTREFRLESGGIRYPATGRRYVRPTHVTLYGYGGSVVVRIEFTGFADGVFYLTGTPTLDPETQLLTVPDLDFTVETRSLLLRAASFLRADDVRADLRERVRLDLRGPLEATRLQLTRALRRRLGPIELQGAIDTLHVVALFADPDTQTMRATVRATGVVGAAYVGD